MDDQNNNVFWKRKTVEQLAVEQGITAPQSLDELTGAASDLWDNEEEFDRFLLSIDRQRREATSA